MLNKHGKWIGSFANTVSTCASFTFGLCITKSNVVFGGWAPEGPRLLLEKEKGGREVD